MRKRNREPEMPGSRRSQLRDPVPGSRFAAFLKAVGFAVDQDEEAARESVLDACAAMRASDVTELLAARGVDCDEPEIAELIRDSAILRRVLFAAGLEDTRLYLDR